MARNMMIDRIDSGTPPDDARPLAGMRCLVLDDEFLIALDVQQVLETAGLAMVDGARTSAAVLAAADAALYRAKSDGRDRFCVEVAAPTVPAEHTVPAPRTVPADVHRRASRGGRTAVLATTGARSRA